jgi:ABC-type multidrug transport system fused ATPase/permease subunit
MFMQNKMYPLENILNALYRVKNKHAKKRLIFNQSPFGGIDAKWLKLFFISLPVLLFAAIFNPFMFGMLGIAAAVVFYIVFLSMTMIITALLIFANNNKVVRMSLPTWNRLFEDVDLKQVLSSGITPYKKFLTYYNQDLQAGLEGEALEKSLQTHFKTMQEENRELFERMHRS